MANLPPKASTRLGGALAAGVVVGAIVGSFEPLLGLLSGLAVVAILFVVWSMVVLWPMDPDSTRANARRNDLRPIVEDSAVGFVILASVCGIVALMLLGKSGGGGAAAALSLVGVFAAWAMLHTMYVGRYARLYFSLDGKPIDFNDSEPPTYRDFYYFSFNLGMTYQVSDTAVDSGPLRGVVLRHCLMSFAFSTVLLAATINLVAGIVTGA